MVVKAPTQPVTQTAKRRERPPLNSGDHLSRAEFQRRYAMYPEIKKAELIEGVVIVGSPVHAQHSEPHADFAGLLAIYRWHTPGLRLADNQSVLLEQDIELQPDLCVRLEAAGEERVQMTEEGLYIGAPDFVVEIAASSSANDLHSKLNVYRRNGVQEYLVLLAYERETRFFRLADGEYDAVEPDADGVLRSQVLPGFRFRSDWFWEGRMKELLQLVQEGIASPEHEEFAAKLAAEQPST